MSESVQSVEFVEMVKMPRLSRNCTITEKIDGTNAQLYIVSKEDHQADGPVIWQGDALAMYAGSRTRWITPEDDNFGFARWATEHADELMALGPGRHFGEWWGPGIQRGYGLSEKVFSLFNTSRWTEGNPPPACCRVVPVLYSGVFTSTAVDDALAWLKTHGSMASPGFMRPEGVVVYQSAGRCYFKKTIERDDEPKSMSKHP